jgi:hypothetical protein
VKIDNSSITNIHLMHDSKTENKLEGSGNNNAQLESS